MRQAITTRKQASRPRQESLLKAKPARQPKKSWQMRIPAVWMALFTA
jgi:hypothetical protein